MRALWGRIGRQDEPAPVLFGAGPIGRPRLAVVHGGEEVRTPEDRNAAGVGAQITQVFAPQIGLAEATRREVWAMMPTIKEQTIAAVLELRTKGGAMARAMGARK